MTVHIRRWVTLHLCVEVLGFIQINRIIITLGDMAL